MSSLSRKVLASLWVLLVTSAVASDHEVRLNLTEGGFVFGGGRTSFTMSGRYNYTLAPNLQIGGLGSFSYTSVGTSTVGWSVLVGPSVNFPFHGSLENRFFISVLAGLSDRTPILKTTASATTEFALVGEIGKRFSIFPHFQYSPSFMVVKVGGVDLQFVINVIAFGITF